jgi:hypothetical protein
MGREAYPSDVTDEEWAFVAPYLTLLIEDAPRRVYLLRKVFNGLRWMVRAGAPWRGMPNDLPPWECAPGSGYIRAIADAHVPPASVHDRAQVALLAEGVQEATGASRSR